MYLSVLLRVVNGDGDRSFFSYGLVVCNDICRWASSGQE